MASKTEKEAKKSAFWGGMIYVPVSLIFVFIGTALFSFYHSAAATLPDELVEECWAYSFLQLFPELQNQPVR